ILIRWAMAIGIVLAFLALIYFLRKLTRFGIRKIISWMNRDFEGVKIKNYQFISPYRIKVWMIKTLRWVYIVLFFLLTGISIILFFIIFPATELWAYMFLHAIWNPLKEFGFY